MRIIKFRGKRLIGGEWVYGSLIQTETGPCADSTIEIFDAPWDEVYVQPESVGQFSGLPDVDGKEIYEGDIIQTADGVKHIVEWDSDNHPYAAGFITRDADKMVCAYPLNLYWVEEKSPRVIGNIHDNPELTQ
jgi:uncharacterized phage protein (TIGR01671 family)